MVTINWNPDKKFLRTFGIISLLAAISIFFVLYLIKGLSFQISMIVFIIGLIIFILSRTSLKVTRLIYLGLTLITLPIGLTVSFVVLAIFYFLLLTPLAIFFRLTGRDALGLKFKTNAKSYWEKHTGAESVERYFHQF